MLVVHDYKNVPTEARGAVLAIGNFDGVHRGHQALLRGATAIGRELGAPSGALIFEPHPREYFHPEEPHFHLTPLPQKLAIFDRLGLDIAVVLPFDAALAALSPDDFVDRVLVDGLGARHVVIGHDFFFGRNRGGTPETMQAAAARAGFGLTIIPPVAEDGEVFSSSAIRLRLAQGDVKGAARSLGRDWRTAGTVVGGAKRGIGPRLSDRQHPAAARHGAWPRHLCGARTIDGERHDGAAYLGTRPTYDNGMPVLEVFLFDFDGDLYGRDIEVEFVDFIRADRKFDTSEALIAQMQADCARARDILAAS